jgi:hypothetical protein
MPWVSRPMTVVERVGQLCLEAMLVLIRISNERVHAKVIEVLLLDACRLKSAIYEVIGSGELMVAASLFLSIRMETANRRPRSTSALQGFDVQEPHEVRIREAKSDRYG